MIGAENTNPKKRPITMSEEVEIKKEILVKAICAGCMQELDFMLEKDRHDDITITTHPCPCGNFILERDNND